MAAARRTADEEGREYVTRVIGKSKCGYCGRKIVIREEGRPAKYCGKTCRAGAYRGSQPSKATARGKNAGQHD